MKVLLLNPPGKKHYLRDYYCTSIVKSDYYYHPVDLMYLSGTLATEHDVDFIEGVSSGLNSEDVLDEIQDRAPDVLICLMAAVSFDEDHAFLTQLHQRLPVLRIIGTGDIFREYRERIFKILPFLDATLVDFSTDDILKYLRDPNGERVDNIIYRKDDQYVIGEEKHGNGRFRIPTPRIELFQREHYTFPFVRQHPFMTVLTDFGCPYGCTFCPISTLGFKLRPIDDVMEELRQLWEAGYREVHFRDQTFAVNKKRTLELCQAIGERFPDLTWSCFSRVDVLDEERVLAMSINGCHTIIVGIEFDDDDLHKKLKKNINKTQMFSAIDMCHKYKINVAGTFILGLPEQGEEAILRTGELAKALDLDFASFNLAIPRLGTTWRKKLLEDKTINESVLKMDTVQGSESFIQSKLSQQQLNSLRSKVERDFYLRPSYLIKRLGAIRSASEYQSLFRNGISLIRGSRK